MSFATNRWLASLALAALLCASSGNKASAAPGQPETPAAAPPILPEAPSATPPADAPQTQPSPVAAKRVAPKQDKASVAHTGRSLFGAAPAFGGPHVRLSYRLQPLRDDLGGRLVHTAGFSGFLPTRYVRAGAGLEAGARTHAYVGSEGYVSGTMFAGYQLLERAEPAVPYLVAVGELGVVFGKHFHTPVSDLVRGAGLELGCDLRWVRGLTTGIALTFMMYTVGGLAYDSWGMRASVGL